MPVASYGPELLEVFRRAARERISISLPTSAACHRLRFRLHNLRKAMRHERHPLLKVAEAVTLNVEERKDGHWLIGRPADGDFLPALRAAGIEVDAAPEPVPFDPGTAVPPDATDETINSVLEDYLGKF